jgi:hypothetical protein
MAIGNPIMSSAIQDNKPFKKFFQEYIRSITPDLDRINSSISTVKRYLAEAQTKCEKLARMNKGQKQAYSMKTKKASIKYTKKYLKEEQRKTRTACKYLAELINLQLPPKLGLYTQQLIKDLESDIKNGCKYAQESVNRAEDKLIEDYYTSDMKRSIDDVNYYTSELTKLQEVKTKQEQLIRQINQCIF